MMDKPVLTFSKKEHIVSRKTIDKLFSGGNRSMVVFPIRMVYMQAEMDDVPVEVMVSVSKRHFKRAVKRNRGKRQIREAYRKNKALLISEVEKCENKKFALAFIYLADELMTSATIEESIRKLLARLSEKVANSLHNEENR